MCKKRAHLINLLTATRLIKVIKHDLIFYCNINDLILLISLNNNQDSIFKNKIVILKTKF